MGSKLLIFTPHLIILNMRNLTLILLLFCNSLLIGQEIPYNLVYTNTEYIELTNPIILCQDSIGTRHYFKLDNPIKILNDEVDSIFIMNWSNLHIGLGNSKNKEFDLFVPLNTALRKKTISSDTIGFSISYQIFGNLGDRIIIIQWKNVKPKQTAEDHDMFNVQLIINEKDGSVSYLFGKMPPFINTLLSLFFQGRNLALYFIDDFKSFSSSKNEIYYVGQNWDDDSIIEIEKFKLLNSTFSDESHSVYMHYDHSGADLSSGYLFKFSLLGPLNNDDINSDSYVVYPNPTLNYLKINDDSDFFTFYEIYTLGGQLMCQGKLEDQIIDTGDLVQGNYILKLFTNGKNSKLIKFVKQ